MLPPLICIRLQFCVFKVLRQFIVWICDFSLELTGHVGKNALHVGKIRVLVVIIDVDVGKIDVHVVKAFFRIVLSRKTLRLRLLGANKIVHLLWTILLTERSLDFGSKKKRVLGLPFPIVLIVSNIS